MNISHLTAMMDKVATQKRIFVQILAYITMAETSDLTKFYTNNEIADTILKDLTTGTSGYSRLDIKNAIHKFSVPTYPECAKHIIAIMMTRINEINEGPQYEQTSDNLKGFFK